MATTKTGRPRQRNSPASGLRLARPGRVGRVRSGPATATAAAGRSGPRDHLRRGRGRVAARTVHEGQSAVGAEQERDPDVAARLAAVGVVRPGRSAATGTPGRRRPGSRRSAGSSVTSAATTPSLVGPVLSWTSSSATRSGLARLVTICPASASNLAGGSPGSRFSTLKVADRQLVRPLRAGPLPRQLSTGDGRGRGDEQLEVAEGVVEHADGGAGQRVADVRGRDRRQHVVEDDPLRVGVGGAQHDAAAGAAQRTRRPAPPAARRSRWSGRPRRRRRAAAACPPATPRSPARRSAGSKSTPGASTSPVASSSTTAPGGTRPPGPTTVGAGTAAGAGDGHRRRGQLGGGEVGRVAPPGRNSATVPVTVTASPTATLGAAAVKTSRPSLVPGSASGLRVLHPEAVAGHRGHHARHLGDLHAHLAASGARRPGCRGCAGPARPGRAAAALPELRGFGAPAVKSAALLSVSAPRRGARRWCWTAPGAAAVSKSFAVP